MSKLSAQCDELRSMAESVGLAMPQAATLMMEAADTIWELRGSVHRERAEADRLRERITTQKQTIQSYRDESREWREVADRAQAENAKLRELATYALKHIIEFECEVPDREMLRGKPCEDCVDYGSSDCPKCMPRMFDVSEIEVDE